MHFLFLSHVLHLLNEARGTEYVVKLLCVDFFIYFELATIIFAMFYQIHLVSQSCRNNSL